MGELFGSHGLNIQQQHKGLQTTIIPECESSGVRMVFARVIYINTTTHWEWVHLVYKCVHPETGLDSASNCSGMCAARKNAGTTHHKSSHKAKELRGDRRWCWWWWWRSPGGNVQGRVNGFFWAVRQFPPRDFILGNQASVGGGARLGPTQRTLILNILLVGCAVISQDFSLNLRGLAAV